MHTGSLALAGYTPAAWPWLDAQGQSRNVFLLFMILNMSKSLENVDKKAINKSLDISVC
jgi:hypothetical protein